MGPTVQLVGQASGHTRACGDPRCDSGGAIPSAGGAIPCARARLGRASVGLSCLELTTLVLKGLQKESRSPTKAPSHACAQRPCPQLPLVHC